MQLTGTIKSIGETQSFGEKGFRKRELVLTTDDQYPQDILVEFVQDKCDVLNKYSVNQSVEVGFNVRGREWTNPQGEVKYFNSIQGWRIKEMGAEEGSVSDLNKHDVAKMEEADDLPF